uniref:3-ketoacyl-CoA synthase n=1 Tax=Kalanchoe fedtschenkoi TaxID=63787 RepID=A0A7N0R8V5_KALFE
MLLSELIAGSTSSITDPAACGAYGRLIPVALSAVLVLVVYLFTRSSQVYLVDFVCCRPPDHLRVPISNMIETFAICGDFSRESVDFKAKVLAKSGIGDEAYMPISLHQTHPDNSIKASREEIEVVLFPIVDELLSKHNVNPRSIGIIVSNCSLFCPTPSITAMIINKFELRSNVKSISLAGMGCSASLLSVSLAKELLKVHKNSLALIVSMEAVSPSAYMGQTKSKLLANTLFRMGGVAILLSNRKQDRSSSKYKLQHLIRTHAGSDGSAYSSVFQEPDKDGNVGVSLSKMLLHVAGKTLTKNITDLAPLVLPYSEQLKYAWSVIRQRIWVPDKQSRTCTCTHVPNFKKAVEHFCIHAGGRAVIDTVEENLRLQKEDAEASKMTLYRFGNTSSSSIWYELSYLEAKGRVEKGDRVWQIAFGSGFKCNSAVWKCISHIEPNQRNVWSDRIHRYPVESSTENDALIR